jgi:hypothetical protein
VSAPVASRGSRCEPPTRMASWRRRLFNRLARWEEASLARSLGLPVERVTFVDVQTALRSAGLRPLDATRASDPS